MSDKPFKIYRSSAGSGKTYRLAMEYLILALQSPKAYQSVLGVTFTNKATEEMKSRIVGVLGELSKGESGSVSEELQQKLGINHDELTDRARNLLSEILHNYSRFSVVTIDSFFHQVIRSFAREIGLQGTFNISLETRKVMQEVIDNLLADLEKEEHKPLRTWLTQFARNNLQEGKTWDFRREVIALSEELLKDQFKVYQDRILDVPIDLEGYRSFYKDIRERVDSFERECVQLGQKGVDSIEPYGGVELFKSKKNGPAGLFYKFSSGDLEISKTRLEAVDEPGKWLTQANLKDSKLVNLLTEHVFPVYKEMVELYTSNKIIYQSLREVSRFFYAFGILAHVSKVLETYRDENDLMLISDLPDFLRKIIKDSDTPFIYEKVGSRYRHFLIDEFQDTSVFQWNNFKSLVKNGTDSGETSMVVGDIKQSIYRWRGGDSDLLQNQVVGDIGDYASQVFELDSNWRSDENLVRFNNQFFGSISAALDNYFADLPEKYSHMKDYVLQAYQTVEQDPMKQNGKGLISFEFMESDEERWREKSLKRTVATVEMLQREGYHLKDIAILTRSQREARDVSDHFFAYKMTEQADPDLKYDVVSSESLYLFSSHAVKFLISIIKWITHDRDDVALAEWFYEYLRFIKNDESLDDSDIFHLRSRWKKRVPQEFVRHYQKSRSLSIYDLVEWLIRVFELDQLQNEYTYLQGFQDAVLDFNKNQRGDLNTFLLWWEEVRKERSILIADENDAIKVLTIHKSKGLEYPIVIIPFLSWSLDSETLKDEIIWRDPPPLDFLDQLPVVPLKYSGNLADTFWEEDYWLEKSKAFLDNLNLIYVAFTRAINGLYVFGEVAKNKLRDAGDLTYFQLGLMEGWDGNNNRFNFGKLGSPSHQTTRIPEYGLHQYASVSWRSKLSLQLKGSALLSDQVFTAQKWGIEFHRKLSRLKRLEDLPGLRDEQLKRELKMIVHHEEISPFFTDVEEVFVESPILMPDGKTKRIDRMILKKGQWIVIDFKTGTPRNTDQTQILDYLKILGEMGYEKLIGYLVYLDPVEVRKVVAA